jgi:hypothetical protein
MTFSLDLLSVTQQSKHIQGMITVTETQFLCFSTLRMLKRRFLSWTYVALSASRAMEALNMNTVQNQTRNVPLAALPQLWNHPLMMPPAALKLQNKPTELQLLNHPMAIPCSQGCSRPPLSNINCYHYFKELPTTPMVHHMLDFPGYGC